MSQPWFWWVAAGVSVAAAASIGMGRREARGVIGVALLGLAVAGAIGELPSLIVVAGSVALAGVGRAVAGSWPTFVAALLGVIIGAVVDGAVSGERLGLLAGASLVVAGWAVDRFALPMLSLPRVHAAVCVVVLALAPFGDAPLVRAIATSVFAVVMAWLWSRSVVDRALFGRPGVRAATLLAFVTAAIVMVFESAAAAPVMMFATIATLLPFFSND